MKGMNMTTTQTINAPIPFQGTAEEAVANAKTHEFVQVDIDEWRCHRCDCKPWHEAALYECGQEPPRADMTSEEFRSLRAKVQKGLEEYQNLRKKLRNSN